MSIIEFSEDLRSRLGEDDFALKWVRERHSQMDKVRKAWEPIWQEDFEQFSNMLPAEKDDWQSKLVVPRTRGIIATIVPRLVAGMFGTSPFFGLKPLHSQQAASIKLRERVLEEQCANALQLPRLAAEHWYEDALVFGSSPAMVTWDLKRGKPKMHLLDVLEFWGDQRARRPSEMRDGMHRVRTSIDDFHVMVKNGVYRKEALDELKSDNRQDPVQERLASVGLGVDGISDLRALDLYEYWGYGRVVTVDVNFQVVVRNEPDDLYGGEFLPYVMARAIPLTGSLYWRSIPWLLRALQDELNDQRNLALDCSKLIANPVVSGPWDLEDAITEFYPGARWYTNQPEGVRPITFPDTTQGLMAQAMQTAKDMDAASGVFDYARGERAKAGETASGIQAILQESNQRFAHQLAIIAEPTLDVVRRVDKLNQRHLKLPAAVRVASDSGVEFVALSEGDYAGDVEVVVSTAGILGNRDVVRQGRMNYVQLIAGIQQLAERADWDGIFRMLNDAMDIPASYRVRLTSQEMQQQQMQQQLMAMQAMGGAPPGAGGPPPPSIPGVVSVPGAPPNNGTATSAPVPTPGPAGNTRGRRPTM